MTLSKEKLNWEDIKTKVKSFDLVSFARNRKSKNWSNK